LVRLAKLSMPADLSVVEFRVPVAYWHSV